MYSNSACLISHYSKLIAVKLEGKKSHIQRQKSHQSWQQTAFLSGLMWGSDEYDGFPVINQTAACLTLGWPHVQNTPAPPGGASVGAQQGPQSPPFFPLPISVSFHPPPSDSSCLHSAVPLVMRLSLSGDAKKGPGREDGEVGEQKEGRTKLEPNRNGPMYYCVCLLICTNENFFFDDTLRRKQSFGWLRFSKTGNIYEDKRSSLVGVKTE